MTAKAETTIPMPAAALKGEQAYELLRSEIVLCRILPGTRFTELELMERYALGKATCRIALHRLVQDGLVTSMPRQGYRVVPVTIRDVEEIFALRLALEPYAARLAAGKADRAKLEAFERACRTPLDIEVGSQVEVFLEANRSFHMAIAEASGNQRLARTLSGLLDEMARLVGLGFAAQGERPNIENDHVSLIESLDAGDADTAEQVARRHVETFREQTMERVLASLKNSGTLIPIRALPGAVR
ncbi:GntR family transcriptional regulator [Terrihabitans sp. B22-R8]|uniref:GntR family transcriptional regulator n=1 Tax=Terrihabitans sp. B22-R8 TaxID=3425128 RepID=UPI00403C60DA